MPKNTQKSSLTAEKHTIDAAFIRSEIEKEQIVSVDLSYLADGVEAWYRNVDKKKHTEQLKTELKHYLFDNLQAKHLAYTTMLGMRGHGIAGVCLTNIFSTADVQLAYLVHEAISDIFYINDIIYPYDNHKALYLKNTGRQFKEWGNGLGEITPHIDDPYEALSADLLSLTICRNISGINTRCYFPKDLLAILNEEELNRLTNMTATFISGKNIDAFVKHHEQAIVNVDDRNGITFNLDFRVDDVNGKRMLVDDPNDEKIIEKLRNHLPKCNYFAPDLTTGACLIIANKKLLHGRSKLEVVEELPDNITVFNAPRLIFRSKGPRRRYCTWE